MNIIITNIGRRGYLVDYFKSIPGMTGKIYTSDCDQTASGLYGNNDGHFILSKPVDDEEKYVSELIQVCKDNEINAILPVIDPEIYILSGYKRKFSENGINVIVSDRSVLDICFDKLKMNQFLKKINVSYPNTFEDIETFMTFLEADRITFPVIVKPILGSGSVDTYIVDDVEKLKALFHEGMIIQEKLDGVEYGIDVFNSVEKSPLRCVVKRKIAMRSGETDKCVSVHNNLVSKTMLHLAEELGHIGNLDCDVIVSNGIPYVIDMNPRFGGGYPATHAIGVNLIEILWKMLNGESVTPEYDNYEDDILVMKEISVRTTVIKGV